MDGKVYDPSEVVKKKDKQIERLEGKIQTLEDKILSLEAHISHLAGSMSLKVDKDKIIEAIDLARSTKSDRVVIGNESIVIDEQGTKIKGATIGKATTVYCSADRIGDKTL